MIRRLSITKRTANLCVLDIGDLKSVPGTPIPHFFIVRVIGTTRIGCLSLLDLP
jgi:hypothetical protein